MALNRAFKVKDDINVLGRILSAGTDLFDIFADQTASFQVSASNATFYVSGGDAFSILGGNGVIVAADPNTETLVISGRNASTTEKGTAQFSSSNFSVTDGDVSIATGGVSNTNLAANSVDKSKIDASNIVYDYGALTFTNISGFYVNTDGSTIEINSGSNSIQVKDSGITNSKLASNSVDYAKIDATKIVATGGSIGFSNTTGLSTNVDNSSIEISSNKLRVKSSGITNAMLANDGIYFGDGTSSGKTVLGDTFEIKGTANQITATYNNLTNDNVTLSLPSYVLVPGNFEVAGSSITQNLSVAGSLTVAGTARFVNTVFSTTSALSVVNNGPGPALYVFQSAGFGDVASFYDGDGVEVLHVGNAQPGGGGRIGINTSYPNVDLTVNGAISSNEIIYTSNYGDSRDWWSVFDTVLAASGNWNSGGGGAAYLGDLSARWENNWNNTNANSGYWRDTHSYVLAKSATWDTVSTNITADNINLRGSSTAVGRLNFGQNNSKLAAPAQYGVNDKITIWDFEGGGTGWNYAIGAEPDNIWFTNDVNTSTGGFKFYIRNDLNFWLRGDGNLILKDSRDIYNTGGTSLLLVTKDRADTTFSTVNTNSGYWRDTHSYVLAQSAKWDSVYSINQAQSANWYSVYNTFNSNSGKYEATYSYVLAQSAKWDSVYSINQAKSAEWNDTYSYVYSNSANYLLKNTNIQVTSVTLSDTGKTSLRKIYSGSATGTDLFSIATISKTAYSTAKFIVTVKNVTDNLRTTLEILAVKTNGTGTWDGTVYGIIDQGGIFKQVEVDTSGSTVDLLFTMYAPKNYVVNVLVDTISD